MWRELNGYRTQLLFHMQVEKIVDLLYDPGASFWPILNLQYGQRGPRQGTVGYAAFKDGYQHVMIPGLIYSGDRKFSGSRIVP